MAAAEVKAVIDRHDGEYMSRFAAGDMAGIGRLYTDDALFLAPGAATVTGRTGIAEFWARLKGTGVRRLQIQALQVTLMGPDHAQEYGKFTSYTTDQGTDGAESKFIAIWRRQGDDWYICSDTFNAVK